MHSRRVLFRPPCPAPRRLRAYRPSAYLGTRTAQIERAIARLGGSVYLRSM